jgi:hypothetical protein
MTTTLATDLNDTTPELLIMAPGSGFTTGAEW